MAKLSLRTVRSLAAGILITIGGCADNPTSTSDSRVEARYTRLELQAPAQGGSYSLLGDRDPRVEKVIGPAGGTLEIPGGHSLSFPAGAVPEPTRIRAKVDPRYVQVDLDPHGIQFPAGSQPTLTLSYAAAAPLATGGLTIVYLDSADRLLEDLQGTTNAAQRTVSARLSHFSRYALVGAN